MAESYSKCLDGFNESSYKFYKLQCYLIRGSTETHKVHTPCQAYLSLLKHGTQNQGISIYFLIKQ